MTPEQTVYDTLRLNAGVIALVAARIYPDFVPEDGAKPYIDFNRAATDEARGLDGTLHATQATMQVVCWAETREGAEALADAVAAAMGNANPPSGRVGDLDPETMLFGVQIDFDIWF